MTAPAGDGCPARIAVCGVQCGCNGGNPSHRSVGAARGHICCEHRADQHDEHGCTVDMSRDRRAYVRCHSATSAGAQHHGEVHTACDKWIRVEKGPHGTRITLTEPDRGLRSGQSMWANLSPRDVDELLAALSSAHQPVIDRLITAEAAVQRVEALRGSWMQDGNAPAAIELRVALCGDAETALRRALDANRDG